MTTFNLALSAVSLILTGFNFYFAVRLFRLTRQQKRINGALTVVLLGAWSMRLSGVPAAVLARVLYTAREAED